MKGEKENMPYSAALKYSAYKTAEQTVSKTRQVVMLYDGAINFIKQTIEAIKKNDIESRFNSLQKACDIILGLQSCLDFERGGKVAEVLNGYYSSIDARLLTVHQSNSTEVCEQVMRDLKKMRDAWDEIDNNGGNPSDGGIENFPISQDNGTTEGSALAISI